MGRSFRTAFSPGISRRYGCKCGRAEAFWLPTENGSTMNLVQCSCALAGDRLLMQCTMYTHFLDIHAHTHHVFKPRAQLEPPNLRAPTVQPGELRLF